MAVTSSSEQLRFKTFQDRLFMAIGHVYTRVPDHRVGAEQIAKSAELEHYQGWVLEVTCC